MSLLPHTPPKYGPPASRIVYTAADANYELQARVLLRSLVDTQKSATHLVVFGTGWTDASKMRFQALRDGVVTSEVVDVDPARIRDVRLTNDFPAATMYNVLAPSHLMGNSGRALYLDADMIVLEDLASLWDLSMRHPVAAVLDAHIGWLGSPTMWRPWIEEGADPRTPYLNTGTLLIDLDAWRAADLTDRILDLLRKYDLPCVDQDAINLVLRGDFDELPPRFNSMPYHILRTFRHVDAVTPQVDIEDALRRPAILHFHRSFLGKPWTYFCAHPATNAWRSIASNTDPGWNKSMDITGLARRFAARRARMLVIDDRSESMHTLNVER